MRILIASDAWHPQINGVVRTLGKVVDGLRACGHEVAMMTPQGRRTFGMPSYPEIRLAFPSSATVNREITDFAPESIHIATEGPIGQAVRRWCLRNRMEFTTSFHTRFAEYVSMRVSLPGLERLAYAMLRRFHAPSRGVLVPTPSIARDLTDRGFANVVTWTRGVDHQMFRCAGRAVDTASEIGAPERPIMISVGRVAVEKGLEDFLRADVPGTKIVIGDGPARAALEAAYPEARFLGYKHGEDLVREICAGDLFVFPSRTDTFGLVMLEAMACGLPVAAYPVAGPVDVVEDGVSGALDDDLATAIGRAKDLAPQDAIARARQFTWEKTVSQFEANLVPARARIRAA